MAEIANQDAQILAQMDSLEADAKQYPMIGAIEKIGPTLLPEYKEAASPGFIPGIEYLDAKYPKGKYQSFPPLSSLRHLPVHIRVIWLYRVSVNSHHNMFFEITIVRGSAKIIKMMMKIVVAKKERRKEMMMKSKVVNVEEPPRLQVHTIIMCHTSKKLNQKK